MALTQIVSAAREEKRQRIVQAALQLVSFEVGPEFDPIHTSLCPIDVVIVAGSPWLSDGLERDFAKDESGYRKIGGGANTPDMLYFFRSVPNLTHYLKRQGLYIPRGGELLPCAGMACFFDWDDRGRFNFTPDRAGIIVEANEGQVKTVVVARRKRDSLGFVVESVEVKRDDPCDQALIGYSDLP